MLPLGHWLEGLCGDGLDHREGVLQPVIDLAIENILLGIGPDAGNGELNAIAEAAHEGELLVRPVVGVVVMDENHQAEMSVVEDRHIDQHPDIQIQEHSGMIAGSGIRADILDDHGVTKLQIIDEISVVAEAMDACK